MKEKAEEWTTVMRTRRKAKKNKKGKLLKIAWGATCKDQSCEGCQNGKPENESVQIERRVKFDPTARTVKNDNLNKVQGCTYLRPGR